VLVLNNLVITFHAHGLTPAVRAIQRRLNQQLETQWSQVSSNMAYVFIMSQYIKFQPILLL